MQKLFYVVCRWLQQDQSRQSLKISNMIKQQMQQVGFNYETISNTQRQRQQLFRQRQKLIRQKEKLQEQKRQIQMEREHNLRLVEEKEKLQRQREEIERKLERERSQTQELHEENQELEEKRQTMIEEYERLQNQRDKIIQERQLLYERMEKIEKLQRLQRMYQDQLRKLREEAQMRGETEVIQEEKEAEELNNQFQLEIKPSSHVNTHTHHQNCTHTHHEQRKSQNVTQTKQIKQQPIQTTQQPVQYTSGFSTTSVQSSPYSFRPTVVSPSYTTNNLGSTSSSTYTYTPLSAQNSSSTYGTSNNLPTYVSSPNYVRSNEPQNRQNYISPIQYSSTLNSNTNTTNNYVSSTSSNITSGYVNQNSSNLNNTQSPTRVYSPYSYSSSTQNTYTSPQTTYVSSINTSNYTSSQPASYQQSSTQSSQTITPNSRPVYRYYFNRDTQTVGTNSTSNRSPSKNTEQNKPSQDESKK